MNLNIDPASESFQTYSLEWVKASVRQHVSPMLAEGISLDSYVEEVFGGLVYQLTAYVLADQLPPEQVTAERTVELDVPATWWQAWKAQYVWISRRWPVRTRTFTKTVVLTVDLKRYRTYPEAGYTPPALGRSQRTSVVYTGWAESSWPP